jgi:polyhydroxybutyrate depolymerase
VRTGGLSRSYLLVVPEAGDGPVPLIVDLHGSGLDPYDQLRVSGSHRFAARGAVVLAPSGAIPYRLMDGWPEGRAWNVPGTLLPGQQELPDMPDDVGFIAGLIEMLTSGGAGPGVRIDPQAVHLMGYSGGARLACQVAAAVSHLASLGCVAGVRPPSGISSSSIAVLAIHSRDDPRNPYDGGAGPRWDVSVEDAVAGWARVSGCLPRPRSRTCKADVVELRYDPDGQGGPPVRLVTVPGVGHTWPGSRDASHLSRFGPSGTFDATAHLWRFFTGQQQRTRPAT